MKAGDVIGFLSRDWIGRLIDWTTLGFPFRQGFSHVAIVANHPHTDQLILWESTSLCEQKCIFQGKKVSGVQAHWIEPRIFNYDGEVWRIPIQDELDVQDCKRLSKFCHDQLGVPYDYQGAFDARELGFGWLFHWFMSEDLKKFYCSEFVPAALRSAHRFYGNCSVYAPTALISQLRRNCTHQKPVRIR